MGCALAALIVGGCGAGRKPSDQQLITQTLHSYLRAQVTGDGPAACALLTAGGQRELIAIVVKAGKGLVTAPLACESAVGLVRAVAGAQLLSALSNARIQRVQVGGAHATAYIVDDSQFKPQQVTLEKAGTSWKIAGVPGLAG